MYLTTCFLPHLRDLALESVTGDADRVTVVARTRAPTACCPRCHQPSSRVHSKYRRILTDLPWSATPVTLQVYVRRFVCPNRDCVRTIFCERLEPLAVAYGRRTRQTGALLAEIGMALGGRAGAALTRQLHIDSSRLTVLRGVSALPAPAVGTVRVLGIDDFAFKRGRRYGTLLCDQEHQRPVDLLPERSADAVAAWLAVHPGVAIITRDRATVYKEGATRGAPDALQVVDRFHLVKNLGEALEADLAPLIPVLQEVAAQVPPPTDAAPRAPDVVHDSPEPVASDDAPRRVPAEALHTGQVSATKQAHYALVHTLHAQGLSQHAIAAQVGINRRSVHRYLEADSGLRPRLGRCLHEPFLPYILQRWNEGCHNGSQLWREIHAQGYPGTRSTLGPLFTQLRQVQGIPSRQRRPPEHRPPPVTASRPVRIRALAFAFLGAPERLEPDDQEYVNRLCARHPGLAAAYRLTQSFVHMLHERHGEELEGWVAAATAEGLPHLRAFATGLREDWEAVQAGLTVPWSNGRSEGFVNKIKMIKRTMFGRAGFALLRQRVLHQRK
jgi:transposase